MNAIEPGHLVVQEYFATCWEATRKLIAEFVALDSEVSQPFPIPAWGDLPPALQEAIKDKGLPILNEWDMVVMSASQALHLHGPDV